MVVITSSLVMLFRSNGERLNFCGTGTPAGDENNWRRFKGVPLRFFAPFVVKVFGVAFSG
jgi:hypothetical protein